MNILAILDNEVYKNELIDVAKKIAPVASMIWYRVKNLQQSKIIENCSILRKNLPNSTLILSSYPDIAMKVNFNGVHLNRNTYSAEIFEEYKDLIIGYSAHSLDECKNIKSHYKTLSPIFTLNKPSNFKPLGLISINYKNIYALGGINEENYKSLKDCGFFGIAGIRLCKNIEKFIF